VDECDTVFTRRGKDDCNEDLRALLNAGYKRGAIIPRCVGPKHEVQSFEVYVATALAGLGDLPETIMSRAVTIRMRRRAPTEQVGNDTVIASLPGSSTLNRRLSDFQFGLIMDLITNVR
jgi:hypothetical protein